MSFDLEKGAGSSNAAVQQPTTARLSNFAESSHFPPTYEHHVNDNMRNFESQFQTIKLTEFDDIQDPKTTQRKRKCPTWVWFSVGISILLIISALLGGLIIHYMNKHNTHSDKTSIATRSEETTTVSPLTTTIFVTQTPPTTSTQVVMITITPSTSTPSIVTVTSTTTQSGTESSSTTSTDSIVTTFSTFIAPVPATTSSTLNPSEVALSSSIAAEISRNSAKLIPSPITTTIFSVTTATTVSVSSPPPAPTRSLIPMPGGEIDQCGVPGQSCNKREAQAQVEARQGFYLGRCGVPGTSCN